MKTWDYYEFNIGSHFLPYIFNDDATGLTDEEIEQVQEWLYANNKLTNNAISHYSISDDETSFSRDDITGLYGDCHEVKLMFMREA